MKSSFQSNNNSSNKNSKFNKNSNDHSYSSSYNSILIMSDHGGGAGLSSPSAGQQSSGNGVDLDAAGSQDNDPADDIILNVSKSLNSRPKQLDTLINISEKSKENKNVFSPASCYINANYKSDQSSEASSNKTERRAASAAASSSSSESEDEDESGVDDDGNDCQLRSDYILTINEDINKGELKQKPKYMEKFERDYDGQVEKIADQATAIISDGSFYDCGLYQIISFLFISIAWTVGNGWYAYVSVFSGYTPEHECDVEAMSNNSAWNYTVDLSDKKCSAFNVSSNETVKCSKWRYDGSQMRSTIISEYDFVCDKDYYFEVAYSIEQIGYVIGTLIFSFIADIVGRKPVLVGVLLAMSVLGLIQQYIYNFYLYIALGFVINALACGSEAVCVTLVLEMFSTAKRTFFGIGIEVVWVIVLASMSPLAYFLKTWREIRLVIFVVLTALALSSFWWCQESIRWLISMSKIKQTYQVIDRIVKYNKLDKKRSSKFALRFQKRKNRLNKLLDELEKYNAFCDETEQKSEDSSLNLKVIVKDENTTQAALINPQPSTASIVSKRSNDKIIDIVKNPKFRYYALIMSLNWFATALVYDGLTYLNNYIGENIFINWISMNLIELPAQFVCYLVISRYGRRLTTSITLILAGLILLASMIEMMEVFEKALWLKLVIFVMAKFIVTQAYSSVIIHAPELFPTNLRSFGYGICLFSSKITSVFSPMISIYLSKIMPRLPALIYGIISISCGVVSLYVPETLNRPLPNSIDDIVKWPRSLSKQEKKVVRKQNQREMNAVINQLIGCAKLKCRESPQGEKSKRKRIHKTKTECTMLNNSTLDKANEQKLISSVYFVPEEKSDLSKSSSASSSLLFLNKKISSPVVNINSNNYNKSSEFQSLSSSSSSSSNSSESSSSGDSRKTTQKKTQRNSNLNKQKSTSVSHLSSSTPLNNSSEAISEPKSSSMPRLEDKFMKPSEPRDNFEYEKAISIDLNLAEMKNSKE